MILEMRSFLPVVALSTYEPDFREPEYTRKKAKRPTYGSVAILKASAQNGSLESALRISSFSVFGLIIIFKILYILYLQLFHEKLIRHHEYQFHQ